MTKAELMKLVGKKVFIYFKGEERGIYGTLKYADNFSAKHDYRKPNYFYVGHTSFKVSHVRKVTKDEAYEIKVITRGNCMLCGKKLTEGLLFCKECEAKADKGEE